MNAKSFIARVLFTVSIFPSLIALPPSFANGLTEQTQAASSVAPAEWFEQIPVDAPTARTGYAMSYDSQRNVVVLFGGLGGVALSDVRNDTYELVDGVWVKRSPLHSPPGWWGGQSLAYDTVRGETSLCGSWIWDGTDWTERQSNTPPGCGPIAFDSGRGVMVMLLNGSTTSETWESTGEGWTQRTSVNKPPANFGDGMAYDAARGVMVLIGHRSSTETWEWDGTDWTLRSTGGPAPRSVASVVYDSVTRRVILYGGGLSGIWYDDTWEWDGVAGVWTQRVSTINPGGRVSTIAFDESRGVTVLFGGVGPEGLMKDTWEWDSLAGTWTNSIPPRSPYGGVVTYDSERREIVLAGTAFRAGTPMLQTWVYGADGQWQRRYPAQSPSVSGFGLAYDSIRKVTVLFGVESNGTQRTWEWDGAQWIERFPTTSPPSRDGFAIAFDSVRGVTVLFGGSWGYGSAFNDIWVWDGTNWTELTPVHVPKARFHTSMTFDSVRGVMVMFGGGALCPWVVVCYLNDTWEWDGSDWTLRSSASAPAPREQHGLAFDAGRGVTVLSNGWDLHTFDTWEWDGVDWTNINTTTHAPVRTPGGGMVYDDARRAVVLFGGTPGGTWEYRSTNLPPTVDAGESYTVPEGGSIEVKAIGSDPEGGLLSYAWDLDNDGTFETPGQSVIFSAIGFTAPGTHTITAQATDQGGLSATDEATVFITYNFTGFFRPTNNWPEWTFIKAGRGIVVKFSLNGNHGLNIFATGYPKSQDIDCDTGIPLGAVSETITFNSGGLSYDPLTDQYSFHWKTNTAWAGTCRRLILGLNDDSDHIANFNFK